jgi:hypothetical protein
VPAPTSIDPTLGTTKSVGRYFGLVSTLPSVVLAAWIYLLLAAGAWRGSPSLKTLLAYDPLDHLGGVTAAVVFALALAVTSHSAQFALVQLLEGYWGSSPLARAIHDHLLLRQLRRLAVADRLRTEATAIGLPEAEEADEYVSADVLRDGTTTSRDAVRWHGLQDAAAIIESRFPDRAMNTMPTRLGNVLRRHELVAGRAVELPVLGWATHIGMVAAPEHNAYVSDQRTAMDLAVRTSAMGAVGAVVTFALLWDDKAWALLSLIPYAVMVLAYRGALTAADSYGVALRGWVDLNRFRLYEALGLPQIHSVEEERAQNVDLDDLLQGTDDFKIRLDPPGRLL